MDTTTRAAYVRGGTSKGLVFHAADLPPQRADWEPIFLSAMGSPDPYGRQLNGMGGGLSSLSKVCVVAPSSRADVDVEYTFAQVRIAQPEVDFSGNCGNMTSAIGPFAIDEGIVAGVADGPVNVRLFNVNTEKVIVARFEVLGGNSVIDPWTKLEGVEGPATKVVLDFLNPGGSATGALLPTRRVRDYLILGDGSRIEASLIDAANPCVFVSAASVGCTGAELPHDLSADNELLHRLEQIRIAASLAMGIAETAEAAHANRTTPFIAIVAPPAPFTALDGRTYTASSMSASIRFLSNGQPHRAIPGTGAICAATAALMPGSVVATMIHKDSAMTEAPTLVRLGHPSGCTDTTASIESTDTGPHVVSASLVRTTRRLFDGRVHHVRA